MVPGVSPRHGLVVVAGRRGMVAEGGGMVVVHRQGGVMVTGVVPRAGREAHVVVVGHSVRHGSGRGEVVHVPVVPVGRGVAMRLGAGVAAPIVAAHRHFRHLTLAVPAGGDGRTRCRHDRGRASQRGRRHSLRLSRNGIGRVTRFGWRNFLLDHVDRGRCAVAVAPDAVRSDRVARGGRVGEGGNRCLLADNRARQQCDRERLPFVTFIVIIVIVIVAIAPGGVLTDRDAVGPDVLGDAENVIR